MKINYTTQKFLYTLGAIAVLMCGGCASKEERAAKRQAAIEAKAKAEQEALAKKAAEEEARKQFDNQPLTVIERCEKGTKRFWDTKHYIWTRAHHRKSAYVSYDVPQGIIAFDADGDTNTVEYIWGKGLPCCSSDARFGLVQPGETKTRAEWKSVLTHQNEKGCEKDYENTTGFLHGLWEEPIQTSNKEGTPCTLIKKELILRGERWPANKRKYYDSYYWAVPYVESMLYFDTDGNTNTVELLAQKRISCPKTESRFYFAKPGDTKTEQQWVDFLSHKDEDVCHEEVEKVDNKFLHEFKWDRIK